MNTFNKITICLIVATFCLKISAQEFCFNGPYDSTYCSNIDSVKTLEFLVTLDLNHQIRTFLPDTLKRCKALKQVCLSFCALDSIPAVLFELTSIEFLLIGGNQLKYISKRIAELKNLNSLNFCGNQLDSLPDEFESLENLEFLSICGNPILHLPQILYKMKNLKTLHIEGCQIPIEEIVQFQRKRPEIRVFWKS
jgi:Leucine-rich repeat (LRR) protein